jgi:hypothetical protein
MTTPRPWKVTVRRNTDTSPWYVSIEDADGQPISYMQESPAGQELAAFIVQAVNHYDEMVEVLSGTLDTIEGALALFRLIQPDKLLPYQEDELKYITRIYSKARALLNKLEVEG